MQQARAILGLASEKFSQYAEIGKQLAVRWLNKAEFGEYLDIMCPQLDPRDPDYTDRRANAIAETRMAITGTYHNERQSTAPDSAWAAFQACVEHIDHLPRRGATKERKAEARFNVLLYGAGRDMKERAFQTACKFADIKLVS